MDFKEGQTYKVKIIGFSFIKDYVSVAGEHEGVRISGILGTREQYPLSQLKELKNQTVEMIFRDTYVSTNGNEYNRFNLGLFDL
jgi:hypothetical protein